jgi:hypothetical protein
VLTSGALGMNAWVFLTTLAAVRVVRFGAETLLAHFYGRQILRWMQTPTFKMIVGAFIVLALIGTVVSAVALVRGSRHGEQDAADSKRPRRAKAPAPQAP